MRSAERHGPQFYFALPRLVAHLRGQSARRTEKNWVEANIVGTAVMLISLLAILSFFWSGNRPSMQLVLLLPTVVITWVFWLLVLYIDAQIIKALRAAGMLRGVSNTRMQSLFISIITTVLACYLVTVGPLLAAIGIGWICALFTNLLAAMLLAFNRGRLDAR